MKNLSNIILYSTALALSGCSTETKTETKTEFLKPYLTVEANRDLTNDNISDIMIKEDYGNGKYTRYLMIGQENGKYINAKEVRGTKEYPDILYFKPQPGRGIYGVFYPNEDGTYRNVVILNKNLKKDCDCKEEQSHATKTKLYHRHRRN